MTVDINAEIVTVRPEHTTETLQQLPNYVGISNVTAGSLGLSMSQVIIPPGANAKPHYHVDFETAIYVISGTVETRYGENLSKSVINRSGDFVYIPPGVPHQPINLSDTDKAVAIVSRNNANEQETVRPYTAKGTETGA